MSKQSEILFLFSAKSHLIYIGFPYFSPPELHYLCNSNTQSHFHAITCLKNNYYYFISNAENL